MSQIVKMVIAGEGGQGIQLMGEILALAGYLQGKESLYIPNFGVEQRGGVSIAFVQIGDESIGAPKFRKANMLVALSGRAIERTKGYLDKNTRFIYDSSSIDAPVIHDMTVGIQGWDTIAPEAFADSQGESDSPPPQPPKGISKLLPLPAAEIAKKDFNHRVLNVIVLGAMSIYLNIIKSEFIEKAIEEKLGDKFEDNNELRELNFNAYKRGRELAEEYEGVAVK